MDKIPTSSFIPPRIENSVVSDRNRRKRAVRSFFNSAGIFVGGFILLAVVIVVTTDIRLITIQDFMGFALDFFLLLFCSYSMYVSCSDSGMRAGLQCSLYTGACDEHAVHKNRIVERRFQPRLQAFCRHFVTDELKSVRLFILANVGFSYELYEDLYIGKDVEQIRCDERLSRSQKRAIIAANTIAPIHLTPDMFMRRGRGGGRRSPLGMPPERKKYINYIVKFVTSLLISLAISTIVLEVVVAPTWTLIATCFIKLLTVVLNGFFGYKFGYENIVIDTSNYIEDQVDLLKQAEQFCERVEAEEKGTCQEHSYCFTVPLGAVDGMISTT